MKQKDFAIVAVATVLVLLVPLVAMQFTDEVNWTPGDFLIGGGLLFGTGLFGVFLWRKLGSSPFRYAAVGLLALALLLVWAELAVGLFGTPLAGN